ncbi:DNA cytosine methyltransferase [Mycolicibacterium sp. XJ2546]
MGTRSSQASGLEIQLLDLFSGAGGLSEGFTRASDRYATVRAVESDPAAAASYSANHGHEIVFAGRIEDWLKNEPVPQSDVVIGGPPCQGFSALGKRDAFDARNQLWLQYAETILRAKPKYFVLENVPAFLTSEHFARFKRLCQPSNKLGAYTFQAKILNAANYGAAQLRKRVILIGHHRDLPFPGFPDATYSRAQWRTVKDALTGLPESVLSTELPNQRTEFWGKEFPGTFRTSELHLTRRYEKRSRERFIHIPPGGSRFDIPDHLLSPCWRKHKSGSGDVMGRLSWDQPSVTIRTEFFKPEKGRYLHPTEDRALTHHEAARIQGFGDGYRWVGSKTAIARQIGNAVPIPLGQAIASHLLQYL